MNYAGINHRPTANYCYPIGNGRVELRLRAAAEDLVSVSLLYGDPYIGHIHPESKQWTWKYEKVAMQYTGQGEVHDYWTIQITPPYRRLKYVFELIDKMGKTVIYGERGFASLEDLYKGNVQGFFLPYVHNVEVLSTPSWVDQTAWYQIFPERFFNGNTSNDPKPHGAWGSLPVNNHTFYGGDIAGITQKLDYIANLGFSGIYMTPIFESPSGHKYDTVDYFKIDPGFGTLDEFKTFVKEAHKRGIKVMLDGVFNHIGFRSKQWLDVLKNQEKSIYRDWFHIQTFPVSEPTGKMTHDRHDLGFDTFAFTYHMPKLNTSVPAVKEFIFKVARYWIEEAGIDGWRLDVAGEVDHPFWKEFRKNARATKSDLFIVGEILNDALPWLQGDEFDSVMNYHLTYHIRDFIATNSLTAPQFARRIIDLYHMYPSTANRVLFNLVDCHDTARFLTQCQNNPRRAWLGYVLQYAMPGTPSVYYGNEIEMQGNNDPDCRRCMIWDEKEMEHHVETTSVFWSLNELRKKYGRLLSQGQLLLEAPSNDLLVIVRSLGDAELRFVLHIGNQPATYHYPTHRTYYEYITGETVNASLPILFTQDQFRITYSPALKSKK